MSTQMTKEELDAFYEKLSDLTKGGTEEEVREYVQYYYPRLPDNVREEILFHTFLDAVEEQKRGEAMLTQVQKEGLEAAEDMESLKAELTSELEREQGKENPEKN